MTDQQAVFQALLTEIQPALSQHGFKLSRRDQQYTRTKPGKKEAFHLAHIRHRDDFNVTADVAIRFDAVEELLNVYRPHLNARDKARTYTIGSGVRYLL